MRALNRLVLPLLAAVLAAAGGPALAEMKKDVSFVLTTTAVTPGHGTMSSLQQELGFWEKEGLNVRILAVEGSTAAVQQVASGNADFVTVAPEVVFLSREKGIPIKAFYAIVPQTIFRVVVPADSPIKSPADFKGKTIGVPSMASASYPFARALVVSAGLDPDRDVQWLATGGGPQAALAMQRGQVQALSIWDTMQASLENRGMAFNVVTAPYVDTLIGQVLIAREDFLEKHPETAVAVARGIAKATMYALAKPEEAVRIHWARSALPTRLAEALAEKLADAAKVVVESVALMEVKDWPQKPYGFIAPEKWTATLEAAASQGQITNRDAARSGFTNQWIEAINTFDKAAAVGP